MSSPSDITSLLIDWNDGDQSALEKLLPLVERELHRLAHNYMRKENAGHTLQTSALVNEAYLRLVDQNKTRWQNRAHFFAIAAKIMKRFLMNYARDKDRLKRGAGALHVSLSHAETLSTDRCDELLALNDALNKLHLLDPKKTEVVELRYFGGLTVKETAEVLKISPATVLRHWDLAKAWLLRELDNEE